MSITRRTGNVFRDSRVARQQKQKLAKDVSTRYKRGFEDGIFIGGIVGFLIGVTLMNVLR